ncbi:MAG TPA: ATP-binding protein [Bacteroidetes bacterium]|nr:ATP-binding protein [Bacteroidota bacterium]
MEKYIPRFFKAPAGSFFLFGPRGTGKSTFLKKKFSAALMVDLLKPDVFRAYSAKPERIIELVEGSPGKRTVIVDEIQKVPQLLSAVHNLIERKTGHRFVLTGSSVRKLKKAGTNLLAGRALLKTFHPFLLSELPAGHGFENALRFGTLPIVINADDPAALLETYVSLYVREEVQYEGFTRNIGNFSRFLEAISYSHASVINISNVARDCEIGRKTVEGYIQILEDVLLAFRLPVFSKKARRKLIAHPKFYFFDTGVFQALRPKGPLDRPEEIGGAALEGLVAQHLRAWNAYSNNFFQLFFWRSRNGAEVDFVLYGEQGIYAIEVKNTARVRPEDLRHLLEFKKDYPMCKMILLYRGTDILVTKEVRCIPCEAFLKELKPGVFPKL